MRGRIIFCLGLCFLLTVQTVPGFGETYQNFSEYGGDWNDVNKTWVDDSWMCWAATASNILAWGGWGTARYRTAEEIYTYMKTCYPENPGGDPYTAYLFWFNGNYRGGGFYPGYRLIADGYYHSGAPMSDIASFLRAGDGVHLRIERYGYAHAITVWGYEYNSAYSPDDNRYYTDLYITDSDDASFDPSIKELQRYAIRADEAGRWFFNEGELADWRIMQCTGLIRDPYIHLPERYFWVGKEAMEGLADLRLYLSFDLKWELPFPEPQPGDPGRFLVQIETKDGWKTLYVLDLAQSETDWQSLNIEIDKDLTGLQKLRFFVDGEAEVCLYRLTLAPLPGAVWLLGSGLAGLALLRRLRKRH